MVGAAGGDVLAINSFGEGMATCKARRFSHPMWHALSPISY
jgi:hypothetical protein